jgi:hypothetical protein
MSGTPAREPIRPHLPYFFEGYRFTPGQIAAGEHEVWVADEFLPLLVRIERRTGQITGPHPIERPDGQRGNVVLLGIDRDRLCVQWDAGITYIDLVSGAQHALAVSGANLAVGPEGVWTLVDGGRLARVEMESIQRSLELPRRDPPPAAAAPLDRGRSCRASGARRPQKVSIRWLDADRPGAPRTI